MAIPLLFFLLSISLAPSHAVTNCASYKFSNKQTFDKCTTLDHLSASLHWTYNSDGTLSIGFVAPPASPSGWVAWGINPTALTMVGTQALIAFKATNGSMTVKTFNLTSYSSIQEAPILYEPSNLSSESGSDGNFVLFGTLKIGKSIESLNQVYQVGSSVTNGVPDKHAFNPDNLASKAELTLAGTHYASMEPAPAPAPSNGGSEASAPGAPSEARGASNAAWRSGVSGLWSILAVLLVGCMVRF